MARFVVIVDDKIAKKFRLGCLEHDTIISDVLRSDIYKHLEEWGKEKESKKNPAPFPTPPPIAATSEEKPKTNPAIKSGYGLIFGPDFENKEEPK